jgi:hypothetical protein
VPYKSVEQAQAMHAKADRGEIPRKVVDHFDKETRGKKLRHKRKGGFQRWAKS